MNRTSKVVVTALAAGLLAGMASAAAGPTTTARLHSVGGSRVTGVAALEAHAAGTTVFVILRNAEPGARIRALLHARTCAHSGASSALGATGNANGAGTVRATGHVLFPSQPVSMRTIADGGHLIAVVAGARVVACGLVPRG